MRVLSVWQPWAWLVVHGYKDVENRTWRPNEPWSYPERIYIHAGKREDWTAWRGIREFYPDIWDLMCAPGQVVVSGTWRKALPYGAIVGEVEITDIVKNSPSRWAQLGYWHWILAKPVAYNVPIPCRGRPGLFEVKIDSP